MPSFATLSAAWPRRWHMLALLSLLAMAGLAQAQSEVDATDNGDPPARVARLSYASGDIGLLPSGANDWGDASINRPLTTGDRLSSGDGANAELEFGGGELRLAGRTDIGLLGLDEQLAQLELTQGTLRLTVHQLDPGQSYEIDTPAIALVIDQPGSFRVDIDADGRSTEVTAFEGGATVYGENNAQRTINPGRSYRFADSSLDHVAISDIEGGDAFDAWSEERDHRYAASDSRRYVDDDVVGYQDLDQYGGWEDSQDYGEVWYPADVAADWAPYRNGRWAYVGPWGWTWMDDAAWGFAPYHYGRWAHTHRGWGWIPGPRGVRPIYAPALVAFVGGGGWGGGIGGDPVGWFPLGPGEIYNPWYRCGRSCYTRLNRGGHGHQRDADIRAHYEHYRRGTPLREPHYANRNAPHGFSAVSGRSFAGGRHVQRDLLHIDPRRLMSAPMLARGTSLRPAPGSLNRPRGLHARALPAGGFRREVVARHAPSAPLADSAQGHLAGAPHAITTHGNVRVLGGARNGNTGIGHVNEAGRAASQGTSFGPSTHPHRESPYPVDPSAGTSRMVPRIGASGARQQQLPSARFAHPASGRNDPAIRESRLPRVGAERHFDNGNAPPPQRNALPQVPRIERAAEVAPPRMIEGGQRGSARPMHSPSGEQRMRVFQAPRIERMEAPRPRSFEAPRPMAVPMRQNHQSPHDEQPRQRATERHADTARPSSGGHEQGHRQH